MLSGDNGLLTKTVESKEETRGGAVQEQRDLWLLEKNTDNYTESQTATSLANLLDDLGPNGQKLLTADEINTINETGQVTIGSRTIVFKEILTIGKVYNDEMIGQKLTYSSNGESNWIVFGKDKSGNILLTTENPILTYSPEYTAKGYLEYKDYLNNTCSSYGSTIQGKEISARSITLNDINYVTGFNEPSFDTYTFTTAENANYANKKVNLYYPSLDAKDDTSTPYLKKAMNTSEEEEFLFNVYSYRYNKTNDTYILSVNNPGNTIDTSENLLRYYNMKYVCGEDFNFNYYVADYSANIPSNDFAQFFGACVMGNSVSSNSGAFCSTNSDGGNSGGGPQGFALRPIVILPSSIEVKEISSGVYDIK